MKPKQKPKMYKENEDYELVEFEGLDVMPVQIKTGKYQGVVYCYGSVKVDQSIEPPKLQFDYIIMDSGAFAIEELTNDSDFVTMAGDILVDVILTEGKDESHRDNYSEEPDLH